MKSIIGKKTKHFLLVLGASTWCNYKSSFSLIDKQIGSKEISTANDPNRTKAFHKISFFHIYQFEAAACHETMYASVQITAIA